MFDIRSRSVDIEKGLALSPNAQRPETTSDLSDIGEHLFICPPMEWLELEIIPLLLLRLLFSTNSLGHLLLLGDGPFDFSSCETLLLAVGPGGVE